MGKLSLTDNRRDRKWRAVNTELRLDTERPRFAALDLQLIVNTGTQDLTTALLSRCDLFVLSIKGKCAWQIHVDPHLPVPVKRGWLGLVTIPKLSELVSDKRLPSCRKIRPNRKVFLKLITHIK